MKPDLTDEQTEALVTELDRIIDNERYPFSCRIRMLKEIRAKFQPYPVREPVPPPKQYAPPRAITAKRRRAGR